MYEIQLMYEIQIHYECVVRCVFHINYSKIILIKVIYKQSNFSSMYNKKYLKIMKFVNAIALAAGIAATTRADPDPIQDAL